MDALQTPRLFDFKRGPTVGATGVDWDISFFSPAMGKGGRMALGAAALVVVVAGGFLVGFLANGSGKGGGSPVMPVAATLPDVPMLPAELSPENLDYTRISVNINNLSGEMAAFTFSEQAGFPVRLTRDFPAHPAFSLQLKEVTFFDALFQFAERSNGGVVPHSEDAAYALIGPEVSLAEGTWTTAGPFAAYLGGSGVSFLGLGFTPAVNMQFLIEPQNRQYILFPDTIVIDKFVDELDQPIGLSPRRPVPGAGYYAGSRSLTIALVYPENPGKRAAVLKGSAAFRLVTRTQTISTHDATDHVNEPLGDASVEIFPLGTHLDGPFNMYRNYDCQIVFHRNQMAVDAWREFVVHAQQAKVSFQDGDSAWLPAYASSTNFPTDERTIRFTFSTSANEKRTEAKLLRIEVPRESRPVLLPFEFRNFPLPARQ